MQFTKLRLEGFKSFVDPTELAIQPGLTGIVGPNGCGKSNLLEALRWVMGESRAKAMRGGGMEDVIFAGAEGRPPRARASVALVIEDLAGLVPERWAEQGLIEITRRIQRDTGSEYRINGKTVRARDVNMLLADNATGATSPALVRQGQIAELIEAKPQKRRRILEDAAGISGLYQRRHESLLKLKAAEDNLARLDDVLEQLAKSHAALARQVGAARRYRELQAALRDSEAGLLRLRLRLSRAAREAAEAAMAEGLVALGQAERAAREAETVRQTAETAIQPAREEEAVATAVLQRLLHQASALAERARQATAQIDALRREQARAVEDGHREVRLGEEAAAALDRLTQERTRLDRAAEGAEERLGAARAAAAAAEERNQTAESALDAATNALAEVQADAESAARAAADAAAAATRAAAEEARLADALGAARTALDTARTGAAEGAAATQSATAAAADRSADLDAAAQARATAEAAAQQVARDLAAAESALAALASEKTSLERLLAASNGAEGRLLDAVSVAPGYEAALGAALGDDLELAAVETGTGWHAGTQPTAPPAPSAAEPLAAAVTAPDVLSRRLSRIWVVETAAEGAVIAASLPPGGRLVSKAGDLWRWDGMARLAADAPSAAAQRLRNVNRLTALDADHAEARTTRDAAAEAAASAARSAKHAATAESAARTAADQAQRAEAEARKTEARASAALTEAERRHDALTEAAAQQAETAAAARTAAAETAAAAAAAADPATARASLDSARAAAAEARAAARDATTRASEEERALRGRLRRRQELESEARDWQRRAQEAESRTAALDTRAAETAAALATAEAAPAAIAAEEAALATQKATAETRLAAAKDALGATETAHVEAARAARAAEKAASDLREGRGRLEAKLEAAREAEASATTRLSEANLTEEAPTPADEDAAESTAPSEPDSEGLAKRLEAEIVRLTRQRDSLGAVNLRAEQDAAEVAAEREAIVTERADLEAAIAKLRHGVASLNREGRQRLLAAFERVNAEFASLFRRLFGGGEARLVMVEDDDPLEAGLEILCQPPGKKLSSLSLLSGGEQTLTALSLILAVFLCQPSPICVLDEVDAPLDDSNTARFCALLDEMRQRTDTRFLIITHHPLTMSRMDRLFGVTMVERGVSQLVSVDLLAAEALVEA